MTFQQPAPATSSALLDFDHAEVVPGIVNDTWFLHVSGTAPCINMDVKLVPMIYIACPDYWGIEVVGTLHGLCLEAIKPYSVTIPLAHITGSKGIEVIGAHNRKRFEVSGGCS